MSGKLRSVEADDLGLPIRPFLYTLDQIATLLNIQEASVQVYMHFIGRSVGAHKKDRMLARNIAPLGEKPDWRVAESELVRWLRNRGYRIHETRWIIS